MPALKVLTQEQNNSSKKRNTELIQSYYKEIFNAHNLSAVNKYVDENILEYYPTLTPGIEKFKQIYKTYFEAFPDSHTTIEQILSDGEKVAVFSTTNATNKGEFMASPPTNKRVHLKTADLYCINDDGKITEHWDVVDKMDYLVSMGIIKFTS